MAVRYRVVLHGFSRFECDVLSYCFKHAATNQRWYELVDTLAESEFIVADAAHETACGDVARANRTRDTLFVGDEAPPGAVAHVARPIDPQRVLRKLDEVILLAATALPQTMSQDTSSTAMLDDEIAHHNNDEAIASGLTDDIEPVRAAGTSRAGDQTAQHALTADPSDANTVSAQSAAGTGSARTAARAAAKRAARLARKTHAMQAAAVNELPVDTLVLDSESEPSDLCRLLEVFGFRVHRVRTSEQAIVMLKQVCLAAVFFDLLPSKPSDIGGVDLCRGVKQRQLELAGEMPAVMIVSPHATGTARVQAKLAGCDAFLVRPVTRGNVARALEAHGVVLPADQRGR